ncbi:S1 domain-containing post-transcriptional regulator GSP13 [Psychrobacillus sp. NPDC096389]|uniref:S1 domain-containing post-transcriptional regulator GSP13 n=1 Tax=Psychrobacillus sp. NPDC096389 TaxID=3364490 RepID=UPI003813B96D
MTKIYKVGDVVTGKVTGIQPYGAFVSLDEHTQGLVHISEITYGYVKEVAEFLTVGQEVDVKILEIDGEAGKISLSIRELQEKPVIPKREDKPRKTLQARVDEHDVEGFNTLKEKLGEWIKKSI